MTLCYVQTRTGCKPAAFSTALESSETSGGCVQLFPYHLAEYVCRVLRVTPFRYYCDLLYSVMRDERSFDYIPNFTVSAGANLHNT